MKTNSRISAADQAYNDDLVRLVGRAGDRPGKRMAAETPRRVKTAVWGAGLLLAGLTAAGVFRPGGSIDADNPVNGGLKPVAEHAVPDPEVPTPTTIIKVPAGSSVSEIAVNMQRSGLVDPNKEQLQVEESIQEANDDKYRDVLPAGADLIVPIDVEPTTTTTTPGDQ